MPKAAEHKASSLLDTVMKQIARDLSDAMLAAKHKAEMCTA